jgi:hypothetical protein
MLVKCGRNLAERKFIALEMVLPIVTFHARIILFHIFYSGISTAGLYYNAAMQTDALQVLFRSDQ